jgi:hypothetical protein
VLLPMAVGVIIRRKWDALGSKMLPFLKEGAGVAGLVWGVVCLIIYHGKAHKMKKLISLLFTLATTAAYSQNGVARFVELLRSDVKTNKKAIIAASMRFSDAQAAAFWPLYRNYEFELDKLVVPLAAISTPPGEPAFFRPRQFA